VSKESSAILVFFFSHPLAKALNFCEDEEIMKLMLGFFGGGVGTAKGSTMFFVGRSTFL